MYLDPGDTVCRLLWPQFEGLLEVSCSSVVIVQLRVNIIFYTVSYGASMVSRTEYWVSLAWIAVVALASDPNTQV